jgi:hypothetical protein
MPTSASELRAECESAFACDWSEEPLYLERLCGNYLLWLDQEHREELEACFAGCVLCDCVSGHALDCALRVEVLAEYDDYIYVEN